jgi:hypothetical protein
MDSPKKPIKVFISSTSKDLQMERQAVIEAVKSLSMNVIAMEEFTASTNNALQVCYDKLMESNVLVGIYACRYGFSPDNKMTYKKLDGKEYHGDGETGITDWEYQWARENGIPTLLFVINDEKKDEWTTRKLETVGKGDLEDTPEKVSGFIKKVGVEVTYNPFTDENDLAEKVKGALENSKSEIPIFYEEERIAKSIPIYTRPDAPFIGFHQQFNKLKEKVVVKKIEEKKIAIHGITGSGKTRLLLEFIKTDYIKRRFRAVLWGDFSLPTERDDVSSKAGEIYYKTIIENIRNQWYTDLIKFVGKTPVDSASSEQKQMVINQILATLDGRILIVLDDLRLLETTQQNFLNQLIDTHLDITYILTTQSTHIAEYFEPDGKGVIPIGQMSDKDAMQLFEKVFLSKYEINNENKNFISYIINSNKNLPLIIVLLANYLKGISSNLFETKIKELNKNILDIGIQSKKISKNPESSILDTLHEILKKSLEDLFTNTKLKEIFSLLGLFPFYTKLFLQSTFIGVAGNVNYAPFLDRNLLIETTTDNAEGEPKKRLQQYRIIHDYALNIFEGFTSEEQISKIQELIEYFKTNEQNIEEPDLPVISAVLDMAFKHKVANLTNFVLKMVPMWEKYGLQYTPYQHLLNALDTSQTNTQRDQIKLLFEISWIETQLGYLEEALEHLNTGCHLICYSQGRDYIYEVRYCTNYAEYYRLKEEQDKWKEWITSAEKVVEEARQDGDLNPLTTEWAERLIAVNNHRADYINKDEEQEADPLPIWQEALEWAKGNNLNAKIISLRLNMARHQQHRFEEIMELSGISAHDLEKNILSELTEVETLLQQGHHSNIFNDTVTKQHIRLETLIKSYGHQEKLHNGGVLNPDILKELQQIEEIINAEPQYQRLDETIYVWRTFGELYVTTGETPKAIGYFMKSSEVAKKRQNALDIAINYDMMGNALAQTDPQEALALYAHALLLAPTWFGEIEAEYSWKGIQGIPEGTTKREATQQLFDATQLAALHRYLSSYDGLETRLMTRLIALLDIGANSHILVCSGGDVRLPNALRNTGKLSGQTVTHFDRRGEHPWFTAPHSKYVTVTTQNPIKNQEDLPQNQNIIIVCGNILITGQKSVASIADVIQIAHNRLAKNGKLLLELDTPMPAFSEKLQKIWWWTYQSTAEQHYTWTFTPQDDKHEPKTFSFTAPPIDLDAVVKALTEVGFSVQNSRDHSDVFKAFTDALPEFEHHPSRVYVLATKKTE